MATTFTTNYGFDKPAVSDTGWGPMRNTNMDDLDAELFKPRIGQSALAWGASVTVDLSLARAFTGTVNANGVIAFANVPASFPNGAVVPVVYCDLILTNGGAFTVTWPGSVTWLQGAAPQLQSAGVDVVRLVTRDGGTTWYGVHLGRNVPNTLRVGLGGASSPARPPLILYQNKSLTTTNGAEVSLATYSLPASALNVDAQMIRITMSGIAPAGGMSYNLKFGATSITQGPIGVGANRAWRVVVEVVRTGAATQLSNGVTIDGTPAVQSLPRSAPAETLSAAVIIDIRANATVGGQTATVEQVVVEYLAA